MQRTAAFGDVNISLDDDLVATAEIRRPPDNFFDSELIAALADGYAWLADKTDARAVVLRSAGKHFCAGADFTGRSTHARPSAGSAAELYTQAARLLEAGSASPARPISGWLFRRPGSPRTLPGSGC